MIAQLLSLIKRTPGWLTEAIDDWCQQQEENNEFWNQRKRIWREEVTMEMNIGQTVTLYSMTSGMPISGTLVEISATEYVLDTPCGMRYLKKHLFTIKK